jgi:hypothetical protein
MSIKPLWFIFLISLPAFVRAEEFNFKQPRDARILVNGNSLPWLVEVDFISINCFDTEKNLLLNRSKSDYYVKLALMQKLGLGSGDSLQIEGKKRISENVGRNRYYAKFEIPKPPFAVKSGASSNDSLSSGDASKENGKAFSDRSDLISRKEDVLETINSLDKISRMQFPIAPNKGASNEETEIFLNSIADFEENCERSYQSLKNEIEKDKLLLSNERKEVLNKMQNDQKHLLNDLSKHAQNVIN